jgi:hypothetical protein
VGGAEREMSGRNQEDAMQVIRFVNGGGGGVLELGGRSEMARWKWRPAVLGMETDECDGGRRGGKYTCFAALSNGLEQRKGF